MLKPLINASSTLDQFARSFILPANACGKPQPKLDIATVELISLPSFPMIAVANIASPFLLEDSSRNSVYTHDQ